MIKQHSWLEHFIFYTLSAVQNYGICRWIGIHVLNDVNYILNYHNATGWDTEPVLDDKNILTLWFPSERPTINPKALGKYTLRYLLIFQIFVFKSAFEMSSDSVQNVVKSCLHLQL